MIDVDAVTPVNEAHRERLDRLKAKLGKLQEQFEKEMTIQKIENEFIQEQIAEGRETDEFLTAFSREIVTARAESEAEQTDLILRIAKKLRP